MSENFLEKILKARRERISANKRLVDPHRLRESALNVRSGAKPFRFGDTLRNSDSINIIAEIKRGSPSKGLINEDIDVMEVARNYEKGGACAISVLTEETFFKGSLEDLRCVRAAVNLPILRKDFIIDEFQIFEAAEAGADAILLIVAALDAAELARLRGIAREEFGLDVLVEVHDANEMETAASVGADFIGVNNRNLHTFDVSLDVSRELIKHKPSGALMIAESGITSRGEILELKSLGFDGFLVGETLMRSGNPEKILEAWV
jgi:indole-3-glycerol phosphate synthase